MNAAYATDGNSCSAQQFAIHDAGDKGLQLVLGLLHPRGAEQMWHYYVDGRTYHGVVVQLSTTPDFSSGTTTVFNNDQTNQNGVGFGSDAEYSETSAGKSVWFSPVNGRYVRFWSHGNTAYPYNH